MPSLVQSYDVLLDLVNDMQDSVSIQLLRDYGRTNDRVVLLNPTESVTLVLESGSPYQYAVKSRTRVASVTARSWRNIQCYVSHLFRATPNSVEDHHAPANSTLNSSWDSQHQQQQQQPPVNGVSVDRLWRDHRFCVWPES